MNTSETKPIMRKIIQIDEERCDGCGQCIPSCAEGALQIVDGKARIVKDIYCDGLGACLGACPQDALHIIEREAVPFDEELAMEHVRTRAEGDTKENTSAGSGRMACGCPGQNVMELHPAAKAAGKSEAVVSSLGHWPVQIRLVPPNAPFLRNADILVTADCAPVAVPDFNPRLVDGKVVLLGCPKFDDQELYLNKFVDLFTNSGIRSVTVLRMEVPCCQGLPAVVRRAVQLSGFAGEVRVLIAGRGGEISQEQAPTNLL
ncbi:MAG: ATP-binding protein [Desulfovibrio sp.]|uniref:ATP-binding protein n=1 Tax=Desulfovibrio sp. 7SRBS1 TaxID=3378064 RepID=UPI003B40DCFC